MQSVMDRADLHSKTNGSHMLCMICDATTSVSRLS
jgi:hypothetical protein